MAPHTRGDDPERGALGRVSRRTVLLAGGAAVPALAGCLGGTGGGEAPDPVRITDSMACDVCGMVISRHPGPNGQIFFTDNSPAEHENPARFDALKQCMFGYLFERQDRGWTAPGVYVTDYSAVDYTLSTEGDTTYISSHTAPESFAPARDLYYVVGSDVRGAMGKDFIPFSSESDATVLSDEHGGDVLRFDDIGPALLAK